MSSQSYELSPSLEPMVFDGAELRVLRSAYQKAMDVQGTRGFNSSLRSELARRVFVAAWARRVRGLTLSGAETLIARDAVAAAMVSAQIPLALCA